MSLLFSTEGKGLAGRSKKTSGAMDLSVVRSTAPHFAVSFTGTPA
jgi:hypothetical protein